MTAGRATALLLPPLRPLREERIISRSTVYALAAEQIFGSENAVYPRPATGRFSLRFRLPRLHFIRS